MRADSPTVTSAAQQKSKQFSMNLVFLATNRRTQRSIHWSLSSNFWRGEATRCPTLLLPPLLLKMLRVLAFPYIMSAGRVITVTSLTVNHVSYDTTFTGSFISPKLAEALQSIKGVVAAFEKDVRPDVKWDSALVRCRRVCRPRRSSFLNSKRRVSSNKLPPADKYGRDLRRTLVSRGTYRPTVHRCIQDMIC